MNVFPVARFSLSFPDRDLPWRLREYHLKNHHGNDVVFKVMMAFHLLNLFYVHGVQGAKT